MSVFENTDQYNSDILIDIFAEITPGELKKN